MKRPFFVLVVLMLASCNSRPPARDFPKELTSFAPLTDKAVFTGAPGQWDAFIRERGWIVVENGVWKLYYTGYDAADGIRRLGLATSPDGLTWTRHPDNPLVKDLWVEDVTIVKVGDTSYMFAEGKDDQAHLLTSTDGLTWTPKGPLDIRLKNGDPIPAGPRGTPTAFHDKGGWTLLYERSDAGIWLARAESPLGPWKQVQDEPVMTPGPDDYDRDLIAMNQVIQHKGRYYAYYHGCKNDPDKTKRRWATCVAESDDLIHWRKFPGNPIVPLEENRSSGIVVPLADGFRLYTMHPQVWAYQAGIK